MTFIVFHKDGRRESVPTHYREDSERDIDAAWDFINMCYPNADYIERF